MSTGLPPISNSFIKSYCEEVSLRPSRARKKDAHIGRGRRHRLHTRTTVSRGGTENETEWRHTGYRAIERQHIRLAPQDVVGLLDDEERLLLAQAALAVEVILQERNVGLRWVRRGEELLLCRDLRCRRLHL